MRTIFDTADLVLSPDIPSTALQKILTNLFNVEISGIGIVPGADINWGLTKGRSIEFGSTTNTSALGRITAKAPSFPFWGQGYFPDQETADAFPRNRILVSWDFIFQAAWTNIEGLRSIETGIAFVWQDGRMWAQANTNKFVDTHIALRIERGSDNDTTWLVELEIITTSAGGTTTYTTSDYRITTGSSDLQMTTLLQSNLNEGSGLFPNPNAAPMVANQIILEFEPPSKLRIGSANSLRLGRLMAIIINGNRMAAVKRRNSSQVVYLPNNPLDLSLFDRNTLGNIFTMQPYLAISMQAATGGATPFKLIIDRLQILEDNPPWTAEQEQTSVTIDNGPENPVPVNQVGQGAVQDVNVIAPNPLPVTQRDNRVEGTPPEG